MMYTLRKHLVHVIAGLTITCCLSQNICAKQTPLSSNIETKREYKIQAAFIYNFMKFIEWPLDKNIDADSNEPMTIGIIGKNPFGSAFNPILNKLIKSKKLQIVEFPAMNPKNSKSDEWKQKYFLKYQEAIRKCYVLYISETEKNNLQEINKLVKNTSVLTISNIENFITNGGMIGFLLEDEKVGFEANLKNTEKARLSISSQLLRLAKKVIK